MVARESFFYSGSKDAPRMTALAAIAFAVAIAILGGCAGQGEDD